jgi:hypothetical protein
MVCRVWQEVDEGEDRALQAHIVNQIGCTHESYVELSFEQLNMY